MVKLIPIRYRNKKYPYGIKPKIEEVPAHFDCDELERKASDLEYSLHTEYSYEPRRFTCPACRNLFGIKAADNKGVPKLWFNDSWVKDFVQFILQFTSNQKPPRIIEIHPPYNDYCNNLSQFVELYKYFEDKVLSKYHETEIMIENRCGSQYSGGVFILSTVNDLEEIARLIKEHELKLRIALDLPQLFSRHRFKIGKFSKSKLSEIFTQLQSIREYIACIHIWGKCLGKNNRIIPHTGTLDSYFKGLKCKDT